MFEKIVEKKVVWSEREMLVLIDVGFDLVEAWLIDMCVQAFIWKAVLWFGLVYK